MKAKKFAGKDFDENLHLELMGELYRIFDFLNKYYKVGLERPVITIASKGNKAALGWFCHDIWQQDDKTMHEINICGEALSKGVNETIGTLLHEIAHMKNFVAKIPDCNEQQRHNVAYKAAAETVGLSVEQAGRFGWANTKLLEETIDMIDNELKPNEELFTLFRKSFNEKKKKEKDPRDLTPVMIGKETKKQIAEGAEKLGITQKEFVAVATKTLVELPNKLGEAAIFLAKHAKDMSANQIHKYLLELIVQVPNQVEEE